MQTKSVKDLARLSLTNPEYISVHAEAATPTPLKLQQAYMVVPLAAKMDVLWGFLKTHLRCRTIVFLSTCKQVGSSSVGGMEGGRAVERYRRLLHGVGAEQGLTGARAEEAGYQGFACQAMRLIDGQGETAVLQH